MSRRKKLYCKKKQPWLGRTRSARAEEMEKTIASVLTSAGGTDFMTLGVSVGDTLRILDGLDKGDFEVIALPAFNAVQVEESDDE